MAKENNKFVNPFEPATYKQQNGVTVCVPGPSIEDFIAAKGEKSVAEYVKDQIKGEFDGEIKTFDEKDIAWLESEIKNHEYNKKNKERLLAESQLVTNEMNKTGQK